MLLSQSDMSSPICQFAKFVNPSAVHGESTSWANWRRRRAGCDEKCKSSRQQCTRWNSNRDLIVRSACVG
jgi:hypothetical protein